MEKLPDPISTYNAADALFEVYRAKKLFDQSWTNDELRKLVGEARKSYARYGNVPQFDEYDKKSAIYLVRVRYQTNLEEWLSTRIVPGGGIPRHTEDLKLFLCNGEPVAKIIKSKLFFSAKNYLDFIAASSRTCGITISGLKQKYTAISFALIHRQFWKDATALKIPFQLMIGTVIDKFINSALTIKVENKSFAPLFVPASELLGLETKLDRRAFSYYAYRYPAYFLNVDQLLCFLQRLVNEKQLPVEVLETDYLRNFGKLLTTKSGKELRKKMDLEVGDGPGLKLTPFYLWVESINSLLDAAKLL